jgi:hypothetical protein
VLVHHNFYLLPTKHEKHPISAANGMGAIYAEKMEGRAEGNHSVHETK